MWYLTEELVVFALADPGTSDDVKARMVAGMLAAGRPQNFQKASHETPAASRTAARRTAALRVRRE